MLMAERYPTYFDGIVVGAPAMRTGFSGIGDEWVATMLNHVAPLDASGKSFRKLVLQEKVPAEGIALADFNGDGRLDFVVSAGRANRLVWYENVSAGR